MGKITRILSIFSLLSSLVFVAFILSVNNDMNAMKGQNILLLIVGDTNQAEVALGIDSTAGNSMFVVDTSKAVMVPEKIVGSQVTGISGFEGQGQSTAEKKVLIGRVIAIKTVVLERIVDMVGGIDVKMQGEQTFVYKTLTGKEVTSVITSGSLEGSGSWNVATVDPTTNKGVTKSMSGAELQDFLTKGGAIPTEKWAIKFGALKWILDGVGQKSSGNKDLPMLVLKTFVESYKKGEIFTYPTNTVTTVIKFLPMQAIETLTSSYQARAQADLNSAGKS